LVTIKERGWRSGQSQQSVKLSSERAT